MFYYNTTTLLYRIATDNYTRLTIYLCDNMTEQNRHPIKKAHLVGSSWVVTIDPTIAKKYGIDEETFFSEEMMENGILLKIRRLSIAMEEKTIET
jgi:hypothetical protein